MPVEELDTKAALVVIDLQKGVTGWPVVLVNVTGVAPSRTDAERPKFSLPPDWMEMVPALEQQANDHTVAKQCSGTFHGGSPEEESLDRYLRQREDLGEDVVLASDAITDRDAESHRHTFEKIFPRPGQTDNTENLLKALAKPRR